MFKAALSGERILAVLFIFSVATIPVSVASAEVGNARVTSCGTEERFVATFTCKRILF
jgi:hypothetical protein